MAKAKRRKKKKLDWRGNLLLLTSVLTAIVFLPTTFLLFVGMLPTFVAALVDRSQGRLKALTVGAMNLAGCIPFVLELWAKGHTFPNAVLYLSEPRTVVVMYFAAAIGYMIEWAVIGIVSSIVLERSKGRIKEIEKTHKKMEEKWGPEVSGRFPLDSYGFPIQADKEEHF